MIIAALVLALLVAPLAMARGEGTNVRLGKRNPSSGSARGTTSFNCSVGKRSGSCVRGINRSTGRAFEFQNSGSRSPGKIQIGPSLSRQVNAPPFVTNGTGKVANLNADKVDGAGSDQFLTIGGSQRGGGVIKWARVTAAGNVKAASSSKITARHPHTGQYYIGFDESLKNCAFVVTLEDRRGTAQVNFDPKVDPLIEVQTWNEGLDATQLTGPAGQTNPQALLDILSSLGAPTTQVDRAFSIAALCLP